MKAKWSVIAVGILLLGLLGLAFLSCGTPTEAVRVEGKNIILEFNAQLHSRVLARFDGEPILVGDFQPTEYLSIAGKEIKDFQFLTRSKEDLTADKGPGKMFTISGVSGNLEKKVEISLFDNFPEVAVFRVTYTNKGKQPLQVDRWVNNHYQVAVDNSVEQAPPFWSFQSGSYESRPDWVLPLKEGFRQENYMGMNASDYGGGTPVVDVWRRDVGIGVGHLELVPKLVSLPVAMESPDGAKLAVEMKVNKQLQPGESLQTLPTFVAVHRGDFFHTLSRYRELMMERGIHFDPVPETAYEPIWCAWGFERNFTIDQIYNALPQVGKMGYKWAVLDDGWQTAEGDWYLVKDKFPRGDADMKRLVDKIHSYGLGAKLWWAPLAVDPGTDLIREHPEYLLLNKDGSRQKISWWDAYYLCPAYPPVQEYTRRLVKTFIEKWGYDGLKIDGQHLNAAPPCYNPAHNHAYPEEAFEKVPEFFKVIYQTVMEAKPKGVVEICPCGTAYAFHTMPYMNQSVASDPESSWQVRLKGKTFKALMGPSAPYYGDHVELSDGRDDFASSVGVGAVIGTKFTWPVGAKKDSKIDLTPRKEKVWQKWLDIYQEKMLPTGEYLGELYDLGFDRPEAHAIRKGDKMYYAFYADKYSGAVELRGLAAGKYRVTDYENHRDLGEVSGPAARLEVEFSKHLLLEVTPL
ncbi:MAG: alpha-galactosidase [Calditrichia bacterium]